MIKKNEITVLFVTDHKFRSPSNGRFYSDGKIVSLTFDRYLRLGQSVFVLSRVTPILSEETNLYTESSRPDVFFSSYRGKSWREILLRHGVVNIVKIYRLFNESNIVVLRLPSISSIFIWPLLFFSRKPYVVEVAGHAGDSFYHALGGARGRLAGLVMSLATRLIVRRAFGAIYVTRSYLQAAYPCLGMTGSASNVEIKSVSGDVLQRRVEKIKNRFDGEEIKVGVIASYYNMYKGLDVLIDSVSRLRVTHPKIRLHILGSGNLEALKRTVKGKSIDGWVVFDGVLPKDKVLTWLDDIDIYCQPSRTEGLPRALIEAISRACPSIGTAVGGIPELLPKEFLVPVNDSDALANKIEQLISSKDLCISAACSNFKEASNYYQERINSEINFFWDLIRDGVF